MNIVNRVLTKTKQFLSDYQIFKIEVYRVYRVYSKVEYI